MAHPFFEATHFPWERGEAQALHRELYGAVAAAPRLAVLYRECGTNLPPLAPGAIDGMWAEALDALCARKLLETLFAQLAAEFPPPTRLGQAMAAVAAAMPAIDAEFPDADATLVLDRGPVRDALRRMQSENGPTKVLLVRGNRKSGKSHVRHLFERAARDAGAEAVYLGAGLVATVDEVIDWLFSAVGTEAPASRDTTDGAWMSKMSTALMRAARAADRPVWIAMDDLGPGPDGAPMLDGSILALFNQFALNMAIPAFAKWFRLVLIHYPPGPVPTRWRREHWCQETLSEADVTEQHVADLLRGWSAAKKRAILEQEIVTLARDVIAAADAPRPAPPAGAEPPSRLERLFDSVNGVLDGLAGRRA